MTLRGASIWRNYQGKSALERQVQQEVDQNLIPAERMMERLGTSSTLRPSGQLIWVHLDNPDDLDAALGLFQQIRLEKPDVTLLVSLPQLSTRTASLEHVILIIAPCLHNEVMRDFLDHWRPDLVLWFSNDMQHPAISALTTREIPALWLNASLPRDGHFFRRRRRSTCRKASKCFLQIVPVDTSQHSEFIRAGTPANQIDYVGKISMQFTPPRLSDETRETFSQAVKIRPILFATGVSDQSLNDIAATLRHIIKRHHRILLVILPKQPEQAEEFVRQLDQTGWIVSRESLGQMPHRDTQIHIADTPNPETLWCRLAIATILTDSIAEGDSMISPLLPASVGSCLIFGSNSGSYRFACTQLFQADGAILVPSMARLKDLIEPVLMPDIAAQISTAAWDELSKSSEVNDTVCDLTLDILDGMTQRPSP